RRETPRAQLLGQQPVRIGCARAGFDLVFQEAQLLDLGPRVKALGALAPPRDDHLVAVFPGAQRRGGQIKHLRHGTDAVDAWIVLLSHASVSSLLCGSFVEQQSKTCIAIAYAVGLE